MKKYHSIVDNSFSEVEDDTFIKELMLKGTKTRLVIIQAELAKGSMQLAT